MKLSEVITPVTPVPTTMTKRNILRKTAGFPRRDDPTPQDIETDLKLRGQDPEQIDAMLRQIELAKKQNIREVNYPDELSISDKLQQYFFRRGYELAGEGRDQMAFESPRGTILKVVGIGEDEREAVVRNYVAFFQRNQRNPFYPRIYNSGEFTVDGETYFVYEMERVNYVADEEQTLDYIEKLMSAVDREQGEQFLEKNPVPKELDQDEVFGLIQATEDMIQVLGGQAPLDLTAVENLGRRNNGHLVIVDPFSL
jgi:hypothetical protein